MGSRAVIALCQNPEVARSRFGAMADGIGAIGRARDVRFSAKRTRRSWC